MISRLAVDDSHPKGAMCQSKICKKLHLEMLASSLYVDLSQYAAEYLSNLNLGYVPIIYISNSVSYAQCYVSPLSG